MFCHGVGKSLFPAQMFLLAIRLVQAFPIFQCNRCNSFLLDKQLQSFYCGCMKAYLNASEVARLVNVDRATVTRWIKKGVVKGVIRPQYTQNWRIPLSSAEELVKQNESR